MNTRMSPSEQLALSLELPGVDYSKGKYEGPASPALVLDFAATVKSARNSDDLSIDPSNATSEDVQKFFKVYKTNTAKILFGDVPFRISYSDEKGNIIDQKEKTSLYSVLTDGFVEEIQSWTRSRIAKLSGASVVEDIPYPKFALREVLANAVAHADYSRDSGDILVELHPSRIEVSNFCVLEAELFANQWLSKKHKTYNKHLMNTLRQARVTDEHGSGKVRIFKLMLEAGKAAPLVEFQEFKDRGRWKITLWNDASNLKLKEFVDTRLVNIFKSEDELRIATALLLWRDKPWSEIKKHIDATFQDLALKVFRNPNTPISLYETRDRLIVRRWAKIAIEDGQITKTFLTSEKKLYLGFLREVAFENDGNGELEVKLAKRLLGMSDTPSETTQLSRLFAEWREEGHVEKVKKGLWKFLQ